MLTFILITFVMATRFVERRQFHDRQCDFKEKEKRTRDKKCCFVKKQFKSTPLPSPACSSSSSSSSDERFKCRTKHVVVCKEIKEKPKRKEKQVPKEKPKRKERTCCAPCFIGEDLSWN